MGDKIVEAELIAIFRVLLVLSPRMKLPEPPWSGMATGGATTSTGNRQGTSAARQFAGPLLCDKQAWP